MSTDLRLVLERVRKLLALADFMTRYRIESAELEADHVVEDEPVLSEDVEGFMGRKPWRELLLTGLSDANGCACYITRNSRTGRVTLRVIGPASPASLVRYMQAYLTREVERLCDLAASEERAVRRRDGGDSFGVRLAWRNSFKLGAAAELRARLLEASNRTMSGASGSALARIQKTDWRVAAAAAALGLGQAKYKARFANSDAFRAGRAAGSTVSLAQGAPALSAGASGALKPQ